MLETVYEISNCEVSSTSLKNNYVWLNNIKASIIGIKIKLIILHQYNSSSAPFSHNRNNYPSTKYYYKTIIPIDPSFYIAPNPKSNICPLKHNNSVMHTTIILFAQNSTLKLWRLAQTWRIKNLVLQ
jgi:hypothetical protein